MKNKILHILPANTFTIPFVEFINKEFNPKEHTFLFTSDPGIKIFKTSNNIRRLYGRESYRINIVRNYFLFLKHIINSRKIILHGLPPVNYFILFAWVFKKSLWTIYGYEIYAGKGNSSKWFNRSKSFILKNVSGHITHIKGDSDLANKIFKSNAKFYDCPIYLSNIAIPIENKPNEEALSKSTQNVLVGNSSSPTNNHISIFKMLEPYKDLNIKVFCPLSYGYYPDYLDKVVKEGKHIFNEKFIPVTDFMQRTDYDKFLRNMDVAIFNHNRQEAMGVTISLLGLGKPIFMNKNTTSYKSLIEKGFKILPNEIIDKEGFITNQDFSGNIVLVEKYYSYQALVKSWHTIFNNS